MLRTYTVVGGIVAMFALPAFAQTSAAPSTSPNLDNPSAFSDTQTPFMTKIEPRQFMASELIGTKVISASNESIGDINDVIVDRNGQAVAAVVGVGGFLGIGEKAVAIPFTSLEFMTRGQLQAMNGTVTSTGSTAVPSSTSSDGKLDRILLRMTKAELQAAPSFDATRDSTAPVIPSTPKP